MLPVNFLPLPTDGSDLSDSGSVGSDHCSAPSQSARDLAESATSVTGDLSHADSLSVISHRAVCDDDPVASWVPCSQTLLSNSS